MKKARMPRKKLTYFPRLYLLLPAITICLVVVSPSFSKKSEALSGPSTFKRYCGNCHDASKWLDSSDSPALELVFPKSSNIPQSSKKTWYKKQLKKWSKQKLKLPRKIVHPLAQLNSIEMKKLGNFFLTPGTPTPAFLGVCFSCHKFEKKADKSGLTRLIPRYEAVALDPKRWQSLPRDRLMRFLNRSRHKTVFLEGKIRHFTLPKKPRNVLADFFAGKSKGLSKN